MLLNGRRTRKEVDRVTYSRDIQGRVKRLETAIHSGWKSYSVTCEADISKIITNEGLIFVDVGTDYSDIAAKIDKRLAEIKASGRYTIIIDDVPKSE
jgi:hypothetical protein